MERLRKHKSSKPATRTPIPLPSVHIKDTPTRKWSTYDVMNMYYLIIEIEDTDFFIISRALRVYDQSECKTRFQNDQKMFYQDKKPPQATVVFYAIALDFVSFVRGVVVTTEMVEKLKERLIELFEEAADHVRYDLQDQFTRTEWWTAWTRKVEGVFPHNFLPNLGFIDDKEDEAASQPNQ